MTGDLPVLPYGRRAPSSGYAAGSTASEDATRAQDRDGRTSRQQADVLNWLGAPGARQRGLTWREVAAVQGWHHGTASRVLSDLHKAGRIARLSLRRDRCSVYVLPEDVGTRDTEPHGRARTDSELEAMASRVEAVIGRWDLDRSRFTTLRHLAYDLRRAIGRIVEEDGSLPL